MSFFPYITWAVFKLNYSASDSADKNGVKNRLKKFISRRPSMKTLQEKGLIKGEAQKTCYTTALIGQAVLIHFLTAALSIVSAQIQVTGSY